MMVPTSSTRSARGGAMLARGGAVLAGAFLLSILVGFSRLGPGEAPPSTATTPADSALASAPSAASFNASSALLKLKLDRAEAILGYSARYQIPADLATAIYDIALQEGIDPQLAFRLVKVESNFKLNAKSNRDAIGYTQVQVPTARFYDKTITEERLYERDTNLRIGFRFLRDLLRQYRHDYELALLAYNRGPARVNQIVSEGGDPSNGYEEAVLKGYAPKRITREMQEQARELGQKT